MSGNPDLDHWEARFTSPDYRFGKEPNEFLTSTLRCKLGCTGARAISNGADHQAGRKKTVAR
jgi:hypothetical protein